jgi:serine/threonine protein kinase
MNERSGDETVFDQHRTDTVETVTAAPRPALQLVAEPSAAFEASLSLESISAPQAAMQAEEMSRTQLFLKVSAAIAGGLAASAPFASVSVTLRVFASISCLILAGVALTFLHFLKPEDLYQGWRWVTVSSVLLVGGATSVYLIGIFSPAPLIGTFGIYFLCMGSDWRVAVITYLLGGILHVFPVTAIAIGWIPDPGMFRPQGLTTVDKLITVFMVQGSYAVTFALARGSRRATVAAMERLHAAAVQVQKREALLYEARGDLDRALHGGLAGQYARRRLGPYTLGEVIGRGGMGEIYRATYDGGEAAVKVLRSEFLADPVHLRRFVREAEIVSRLHSPHVARVLSFGNLDPKSLDANDAPYIAMELLTGHDLAWHLRREQRLKLPVVIEMMDHVGHALTAACEAEIVHRDLKPQNLFGVELRASTREEGAEEHAGGRIWKVLDFGVSKLGPSSGTLTQGVVVGTPGYMSPEQVLGDDVGPQSDVFSLAVIAYRALTGRPAFIGGELPRVLFNVSYTQPARPGELASMPEDVERVLALGMAKRVEERMPSARSFADALSQAAVGNLDPAQRKHADRLLKQMPWGFRPPEAGHYG